MAPDRAPGEPRSLQQPAQLPMTTFDPTSDPGSTSFDSSSSPSLLFTQQPKATKIAGQRRVLTRRQPTPPRPPSPPTDPLDPDEARRSSSSTTSTSGKPPSVNPVPPDPHAPSILNLNSAATGDYSRKLLTVQVTINGIPCNLLVDSGASRNFINESFADNHRLRLTSLSQSLRIRLADGTLSATALELKMQQSTSVLHFRTNLRSSPPSFLATMAFSASHSWMMSIQPSTGQPTP